MAFPLIGFFLGIRVGHSLESIEKRGVCIKERISPKKPLALPLLLAIDAQLAMSGGFLYSLQCRAGGNQYCASHIGCSGGCGGS